MKTLWLADGLMQKLRTFFRLFGGEYFSWYRLLRNTVSPVPPEAQPHQHENEPIGRN